MIARLDDVVVRFLMGWCAIVSIPIAAGAAAPAGWQPAWAGVELIAPPTRYAADVEHYRFNGTCDVGNPSFYPIPQDPVTRESYMRAVDASDPAGIAARPGQGMGGPSAFLPVLAKYAQTGQATWGDAIVAMLKHFHAAMQQEVAAKKWVEEFEFAAAYIPLYRRCLLEKGGMKLEDAWFREMWLYYCRNLHVWGTEPVEWRGGCHRAMPEAISKGLAARWYPDIPEAAHWKRYSELVLGDFRRHKDKDASQNDTGYMFTSLTAVVCNGDLWTGDDSLYTDPGIRRVWERLMVEVSPDGAVNPYGPSSGWNAAAATRMYMLERLAAKTRDGRYRFVAHKLFNYLRYQAPGSAADSFHVAAGPAALAWLYADDSIAPVKPFAGSLWNDRMEIARLPHKDKQLTERLLGSADPDPNKGWICCAWVPTGKLWPDKLVLRSGWNPGDFFAIVELHPTSFPANPGGIMGLDRWGAPFTQIVTSKGASVENRALIEDVDQRVRRRYHPDKLRIDELWRAGTMPDIRSEVTFFKDTPQATYARVRVENMDGLPVVYEREFVFVKNRFLATREMVTFEESFKVRVAPLWNTHNVGPQLGSHWANTFIHQPVGENHTRSMKAPPADLLVWFAPRSDCRLQVVDRTLEDPRVEACPNQVRYMWQGTLAAGQKLVFTQLYYPHPPYRPRTTSNNPIPGMKAAYADELQATAHASGIKIIRDDPEASVLRLELEPGNVEWVAFNPTGQKLRLDSTETSEPYVYVGAKKP